MNNQYVKLYILNIKILNNITLNNIQTRINFMEIYYCNICIMYILYLCIGNWKVEYLISFKHFYEFKYVYKSDIIIIGTEPIHELKQSLILKELNFNILMGFNRRPFNIFVLKILTIHILPVQIMNGRLFVVQSFEWQPLQFVSYTVTREIKKIREI